jgi:hypothetical protein
MLPERNEISKRKIRAALDKIAAETLKPICSQKAPDSFHKCLVPAAPIRADNEVAV